MSLTGKGLTFAYPGNAPVLEGIDIACPAGACTAFVGPNGAGKSTLLRLLLGLVSPTKGTSHFDGVPLASLSARLRAQRLAYVPQRPVLTAPLTVLQFVSLSRLPYKDATGAPPAAVHAAIETFALLELASRPFHRCSVGQQQRASLARAFAQLDLGTAARAPAARALVLDEPTSAMDPRHAQLSLDLLGSTARSGVAVVAALHDLQAAYSWSDHAVLLRSDGTLAASGPTQQTLTPESVSDVFGAVFTLASTPSGPSLVMVPSPIASSNR